jgi:predicted lipid-binding transport protein (Tim44 family)
MDNGATHIAVLLLVLVCFWVFYLWRSSRRLNKEIMQMARHNHLIWHDDKVRTLCKAIHLINPDVSAGKDYVIRHDDPAAEPELAEWRSFEPRPTREQIQHALTEVRSSYHEEEYAEMRRAEYPSFGEQLEAAYEARQGDFRRQRAVDEKIRLVREKYPKSGEIL